MAVCLKCGVEVKCPGGTTNLTSHVRRHHPQLLSKTQYGAETIKETPKVKKSDGTFMSFIVIFFYRFRIPINVLNKPNLTSLW